MDMITQNAEYRHWMKTRFPVDIDGVDRTGSPGIVLNSLAYVQVC